MKLFSSVLVVSGLVVACAAGGDEVESERASEGEAVQEAEPAVGLTGEILFYSEASPPGQLYLLDLATGEVRALGRSGSRPDHYPAWSPDGQRIVFESYRAGGWHSWVMDADGSNARRISDLPGGSTRHYEFDASFAPDSDTIVFINGFDLYVVSEEDRTPRRVGPATPALYESAPNYSPDGSRITFEGYREDEGYSHVYTVTADGQDRRRITSGESNNRAPIWSPDGRSILFYSDRDGSMELYEVSADGEGLRPVLQPEAMAEAGFAAAAPVDPWDNDDGATLQYRASYSPDGRWIAFSRDLSGDRELFVSNREGTEIRRVTFREGHDGFPAWRPTGSGGCRAGMAPEDDESGLAGAPDGSSSKSPGDAEVAYYDDGTQVTYCDGEGRRYDTVAEARAAGLSDAEFGATYCPEHLHPTLHPSWDVDGDGVNDCERDGSCDHTVDYTEPRPEGAGSL